jgi:hypothetical protein
MRGGDPADASLEQAYHTGIVAGSLTYLPGSRLGLQNPPMVPLPVWLSTGGAFCVGFPDGTVVPLTEAQYAADVGDEAAAVFIQQSGSNRLVVTTREPRDNVFAVSDSVSIEVVRNGITP